MVLEPYITVPAAIEHTGYGITANDDTIMKDSDEAVRTHHYNAVIKEYEDIEKRKK
jgi:hypothetical protein